MPRKYTTKAQDRAFMASLRESMAKTWKVGDKVCSYDLQSTTEISAIDGSNVKCSNGDSFHVSKCRVPGYAERNGFKR